MTSIPKPAYKVEMPVLGFLCAPSVSFQVLRHADCKTCVLLGCDTVRKAVIAWTPTHQHLLPCLDLPLGYPGHLPPKTKQSIVPLHARPN